ncbi:Sucrase/ferredoxin-like-domain-containing protein [Zychaea mexicana]|uniref:Sucrase/ferredoxin-like-domain-containing protein n=1 Tax=Zychaea mexicana TaxID=64656 RepID=UPI0022FEA91A|nr:Sucrase/ferredoxin-like-domain-containing protein [Zychaea mexicana]KAI9499458.1 Sucrase/ferredoxin-like-domain-containing protein [Zychaea mexicana]
MEWLSKCVNSLYPSACPDDCAASCLPSLQTTSIPSVSPASDCQGCVKPCALHPIVPTQLNIDQSRPLYNTVPGYAVHFIILTGKTDWPPHIEDDDGLARALIEAINKDNKKKQRWQRDDPNRFHPIRFANTTQQLEQDKASHRIMVTNASLPSRFSTQRNAHDVILMPDNVIIANVTPRRATALLDFVYGCPSGFVTHPSPYINLLLVCGHARKDKRCGTIGPMLQKALEDALRLCQVEAQVALVSHLGGHAFAGNLVVYTHQGQRAIWYGRVTPCHCLDIVQQSVAEDKVIQQLLRAVFQAGCAKAQQQQQQRQQPQPCAPSLLDW